MIINKVMFILKKNVAKHVHSLCNYRPILLFNKCTEEYAVAQIQVLRVVCRRPNSLLSLCSYDMSRHRQGLLPEHYSFIHSLSKNHHLLFLLLFLLCVLSCQGIFKDGLLTWLCVQTFNNFLVGSMKKKSDLNLIIISPFQQNNCAWQKVVSQPLTMREEGIFDLAVRTTIYYHFFLAS